MVLLGADSMTVLRFYEKYVNDTTSTRLVGELDLTGKWQGSARLGEEVQAFVKDKKVDLKDEAGRRAVARSFSGVFVTVVEVVNAL